MKYLLLTDERSLGLRNEDLFLYKKLDVLANNIPVYGPILMKLLIESLGETKLSDKTSIEYDRFLDQYGVSLASIESGLQFPPGHPTKDQLYRQHPLGGYEGSGKENVYIPYESFDEILIQEREAELKKILVELGATKIELATVTSSELETDRSFELNGNLSQFFDANFKNENSTKSESIYSKIKLFTLQGKEWIKNSRLDRSNYKWLAFEPDWESIVEAREVGYCLGFEKTLSQTNTSVIKDNLSIELQIKLLGVGYKQNKEKLSKQDSSWVIRAEFGTVA